MSDKDPFFVSESNKRGLIFFLVICLVVVFIPRITMSLGSSVEYRVSSAEIDRITEARERFETKTTFFKRNSYHGTKFKVPKHKFDPNTYSQKDWEALGLSSKQAAVVIKFCQRGIYSNDQLQKIFVIPEKLYMLIKDSTFYPSRINNFTNSTAEKTDPVEKLVLVDVNRASLDELDKIPGIGSFYAKNILNYRVKLGGFVSKEQLLEVWKMDPAKYSEIERFIYVDVRQIEKININEVSVEVLRKHPYMNWNIANSIVKMRNQKKTFQSIDELKESVLIDQELFEKLKPYLIL